MRTDIPTFLKSLETNQGEVLKKPPNKGDTKKEVSVGEKYIEVQQ